MNATTTASAATTNIGQSLTPQMAKKGIMQGNTQTSSQGNSGGGGGGGGGGSVGAGGINSGGVLTPGGHHDQQASTPMSGKIFFSLLHNTA